MSKNDSHISENNDEDFTKVEEIIKQYKILQNKKFTKEQHNEHEENINIKIGLFLDIFDKQNSIIQQYDGKFFQYYEELRNMIIYILNEIVDNYTYKRPFESIEKEFSSFQEEMKRLQKENQNLKSQLLSNHESAHRVSEKQYIKPQQFANELVSIIEEKTEQPTKSKKLKKSKETGNRLLQWKKSKDFHQRLGKIQYRQLTAKQLGDIINHIYESKQQYDKNCASQNLPFETLEQHMYNYLKQKYGLNNILMEWVFAILDGIQSNSSGNSDIALFALILKNEIDEGFKVIIDQIRETLQELVMGMLQQEMPNKIKEDLLILFDEKINGTISLQMAQQIVNLMYTDENPKKIDILQAIEEKAMKIGKNYEIEFKVCEFIIISNQIQTHYEYLANLRTMFREHDYKNFGYINRDQYLDILNEIDPQMQVNRENILNIIDPQNSNIIVFSQVVDQFTNLEIREDNGEMLNFLQKVYSKE